MVENGSKGVPVTREMIVEEIDAELAEFTDSTPAESRDSTFSDRMDVMTHIRDALYSLPIPEELNQSVFERENILSEVFLYWIDEAARNTPNMDKVALAYESAANWLAGVRHEYRSGLLSDRLAAEHEAFLEEERQKTPDEIIADAWMIACKADLVMALRDEDLSPQNVDALLTIEHPLHTIYVNFLSKDCESHMYDLVDSAIETAQDRHHDILTENIDLKLEDAITKQRIDEYLKVYGGPESSDEQADPELEP